MNRSSVEEMKSDDNIVIVIPHQLAVTMSDWKSASSEMNTTNAGQLVLNLTNTNDVISCTRTRPSYNTRCTEYLTPLQKNCNRSFERSAGVHDGTGSNRRRNFFHTPSHHTFIGQPTAPVGERQTSETTTSTKYHTKLRASSSSPTTSAALIASDTPRPNLIGKPNYVSTAPTFGGDFPTAVGNLSRTSTTATDDSKSAVIGNRKKISSSSLVSIVEGKLASSLSSSVPAAAPAPPAAHITVVAANEKRSQNQNKWQPCSVPNGSCHSAFVTDASLQQFAVDSKHTKTVDNIGASSSSETIRTELNTRSENSQGILSGNLSSQLPPNRSLVAQRKLDLSRKFELQLSPGTKRAKDYASPVVPKDFPCVDKLVQLYTKLLKDNVASGVTTSKTDKMVVHTNEMKRDSYRSSPLSDEGCTIGQSPYSSDCDDNESIRTTSTTVERKLKDKVARSASSDSALGLDVEDHPSDGAILPPSSQNQGRRMTLTVTDLPLRPALLPLAEPTALPDSPTTELQMSLNSLLTQTAIPSKVLLEERVVEIPEDRFGSLSSSRRESAQSCMSDFTASECGSVRFVRTPSVVVSDYSDDVMCGITLEEIEYFRAQRMHRRRSSAETTGTEKDDAASDVSASSSCSNLYYCGSTISALDGAECYINGTRMQLNRKTSDCSTCSMGGTTSGDEETPDTFAIPEQPEDISQMHKDLADMLSAQHLSSKKSTKKVGGLVDGNEVYCCSSSNCSNCTCMPEH